jgi:hypothetical protein
MEQLKSPEQLFENLYQQILNSGDTLLIENLEGFSKTEFLEYLSQTGKFVFHGTNNSEIEELEPRQASCRSKKFGNLNAVYSTTDPVLPTFHAVFNKTYFSGVSSSGVTNKEYKFAIDGTFGDGKTWTNGCVYILDRNLFQQGEDDFGKPIDEFVSEVPVKPKAKLLIIPNDFEYIEKVEIK